MSSIPPIYDYIPQVPYHKIHHEPSKRAFYLSYKTPYLYVHNNRQSKQSLSVIAYLPLKAVLDYLNAKNMQTSKKGKQHKSNHTKIEIQE